MALVQSWCSAHGGKEQHYHLAHYDPFQFFNQHIDARLWSGHLMYTASSHLPNHTRQVLWFSLYTGPNSISQRLSTLLTTLTALIRNQRYSANSSHTSDKTWSCFPERSHTCSDHLLRRLSLRDLSSSNTSIFHLMTTKNRGYEKGMGK